MIIVGLDPGSVRMGYGILRAERGKLEYIEAGVLEQNARWPRSERILGMARDLEAVLDGLFVGSGEVSAAAEDNFGGKGMRSSLAIAEARGVAIGALATREIAVTLYPPATVKKAVTGKGNATKEQVAWRVRLLLDMNRMPEPDAADALAVAATHAIAVAP